MAAPEQLSNGMGASVAATYAPVCCACAAMAAASARLLQVRRRRAQLLRRRAQLRRRRSQLLRRRTQRRRWQRQHLLLIPLRRRQLFAHLQVANSTRVSALAQQGFVFLKTAGFSEKVQSPYYLQNGEPAQTHLPKKRYQSVATPHHNHLNKKTSEPPKRQADCSGATRGMGSIT